MGMMREKQWFFGPERMAQNFDNLCFTNVLEMVSLRQI
jgi:hypothetical protein